jgi:hypothetical protein
MNLYKLAIGITNTLDKDKDTINKINKDKLKYDIYKKIKNLNIRKSNNNIVNNYYYKGNDDNEDEDEKFNDVMNQVKDDLNDIDKDIFKSYHN